MRHTTLPGLALPSLLAGLLLLGGCDTANKNTQEQTTADKPSDSALQDSTKANLEPAAKGEEQPPAGKLPDGVRPKAYRLDLTLDPRQDRFHGQVEIDIDIDNPTDHIWMHGNNIDVTHIEALLPGDTGKQKAEDKIVAAHYRQMLDSGVVRVDFAGGVPAGELTLRIHYNAPFDKNLAGLFKVEEQGDAYALAKSESIQARRFLPGFDEPGLKATYDISLTIPKGYVAIGNAPEIGRSDVEGGLEKVTFAQTRPMSTYLLSLAVGPFDVVERPAIPANKYRKQALPLRGFARKGRGDDLKYILDVTPQMLRIFEEQLQRPYPFKKLDIVAAPQWPSGATELSAAITYREERILVEGDEPAPGLRLALLGVHAHEIAHMWFGNLVTPPWWDDLWLKEGFATWGTPLALTIMEPDGGHDLNAAVSAIRAMKLDSLASTRAIREPITDNNDIRNAYDAITYSKSLGVIHMVDEYFGADTFRPALGRYIETFADGVADSPDFYKVIGEETNSPQLTDTFRTFVEQKGVPQLDLTFDCSTQGDAKIRVKQKRYKPLGSPIQEVGQRWSIPFCMRASNGVSQCEFLTESEQTVDVSGGECPKWVMPNVDGSGYYRFNLKEKHWQSLLAQFDNLSPTERLSLIDSAFAAFEAGNLKPAVLTEVIRLAASADKRQVVEAPLSNLSKYTAHYVDPKQAEYWRAFLSKLYSGRLEALQQQSDADSQLLYSRLIGFLALEGKNQEARKTLRDKAEQFTGFRQPRNADALDSDLYEAALTVAVQDSGKEFLNHLIKVRGELDDPRFESASASAIGRVTDPAQLDTIHSLALSDKLGSREAFGLIQNALAEPALQDRNWQWLQDNFSRVVNKIPEQWRRDTPRFAAHFCDQNSLQQVQMLFTQQQKLVPGYERALAQTEEGINLCMALKEKGQALAAELK
ncbi:M1 family metallopeptidase [Microbulbifer sp. SH-1]|uniref:M1 family metallopeptidase n=1 Tax=Microbulbifer sp. SH-1 TaxID=2681547 RepID=UPI001F101F17|nr:M1 family metallopeptidase [Microbulbifer sp. SH-1]